MRRRETGSWNIYEFGPASVFVKPHCPGCADGLTRTSFHCKVHPAAGGPVYEVEVDAFFTWDAANRALAAWQEGAEH